MTLDNIIAMNSDGDANAPIRRVVEPLCAATGSMLQPPALRETDHLFITLGPKGDTFILEVKCLEVLKIEKREHWFDFYGEKLGPEFVEEHPMREKDWPGVSPAAKGFFSRIPECRWLGNRGDYERRHKWEAQATDFTALLVHHCWTFDKIHFCRGLNDEGWFTETAEEAQTLYRFLIARFMGQTRRANNVASFKIDGDMPDRPEDWVIRDDARKLADYQELGAMEMASPAGGCGLFFDRGAGKTATAIQAISHLSRRMRKNHNRMTRILVICPGQVRLNWLREFERFATVPGKATVAKGSLVKRVKALTEGITTEEDAAFGAVIISIDSFVATFEHFCRVPWDFVLVDESHMFKSRKTNRWTAMEAVRDVAARTGILTGSPIGNTPFDLWTQLEFLGKGMSGFAKFENFRKFYGKWEKSAQGKGVEKLVSLQNVPLLQERLARTTFMLTKAEAGLKLPDKVYDVREVKMTKAQAELYDKVSSQLAIEIKEKLANGGTKTSRMTVENILTRLLRLAQITSGHVVYDAVFDPDSGEPLRERQVEQISHPNKKVKELIALLQEDWDEDPHSKAIVWAIWRPDIKEICRALEEEGVEFAQYWGAVADKDRDGMVERFNNDPECRVIVCNPQTAGEGLNLVGYDWDREGGPTLSTNCDREVFFSQNWSALLRGQAEDRAHRRGTRTRVRITDLVCPGTIDEEIRQRVYQKQDMARIVLDIRGILEAVLGV